jgi:hypothetical protein
VSVAQSLLRLAVSLGESAKLIDDLRAKAATALRGAEIPSEDEAVISAVETLEAASRAITDAYESAARSLDAEGGSWAAGDEFSPVMAACLRLEGRLAQTMPGKWLTERAGVWRDIADLATDGTLPASTK